MGITAYLKAKYPGCIFIYSQGLEVGVYPVFTINKVVVFPFEFKYENHRYRIKIIML